MNNQRQVIDIREKLPPHDVDAEESVIGALLIDGDCIHDLVSILKPEDFFTSKCQWLYEACLKIMKRGEAINQITAARELSGVGKLEDIGGASHLSQLIAQCPTSEGVVDYARIVKNTAIARKAISAGLHIQAVGFTETDPVKMVAEMEKVVLEVQKEVATPKLISPTDLAVLGVGYYDELYRGKRKGINTGFVELDDILGGIFGGELCYLAGRPAMAKTDLALSIAEYAGKNHGNVLLASLEQHWSEILDRFVARDIGVSPRKLRIGNYSEDLMKQISSFVATVPEKNMYFYDSGGNIDNIGDTPEAILSIANHMKLAFGLSAIIIDYLQLMDEKEGDKLYEKVTMISKKLKRMARVLDVPVICLCQLNREVEKRADHHPILSDLRESGSIEQDGDIVLFTFRPEKYYDIQARCGELGLYVEGINEVVVGKHRQVGEMAGTNIPLMWSRMERKYKSVNENNIRLHVDSELRCWCYKSVMDLPEEFRPKELWRKVTTAEQFR